MMQRSAIVRTLVGLLLLGGTAVAAPVSSSYSCVQGHEQAATDKLQDYIKHAAIRFFRSRRIAIDPSKLQVNVNLAMQTGAERPYAGFTGSAGAAAFAANLSADMLGTPSSPGSPGGAGPAGSGPTGSLGAGSPGAGSLGAGSLGASGGRPAGSAGAGAGPGSVPPAVPGAAAGPGSSAAAYVGGGFGLGIGLGGSAPAATVTAKDGTRFEILFSSGSDIQDTGAYRIIATQRGFTREGNPIGRHCHLRLFQPGDFNATRTLLVINTNSGRTLGLIPLPLQIRVY